MAMTLTQLFRADIGGAAWRTYEIVHDSGTTKTLTAASMELDGIHAIIGITTRDVEQANLLSALIHFEHVSVNADRTGLVWSSTTAGTQSITVVGW